jgi:hypothetical protein
MPGDRDPGLQAAFREAPLAMVGLFLGIVLGGGTGAWILIRWIGIDATPAELAGLVIVGAAIAGGLVGVVLGAGVRRALRALSGNESDR